MDEKKLRELGEFLRDVVNSSQQRDEEFTASQLIKVLRLPGRSVRDWLEQAEMEGILKSRKTSHYRFYSVCNEEEWKKWLNQRNQNLQEKEQM